MRTSEISIGRLKPPVGRDAVDEHIVCFIGGLAELVTHPTEPPSPNYSRTLILPLYGVDRSPSASYYLQVHWVQCNAPCEARVPKM